MSTETWFSLGEDHRGERFIRAWKPGDGLHCTHASIQRRHPCGKPVAIIKRVDPQGRLSGRSWVTTEHVRTICAGHLARDFALSPGQARLRAEKEAREKIITNHWDEYAADLGRRIKEWRQAQIDLIPEAIQKILGEIDWDTVDEPPEGTETR